MEAVGRTPEIFSAASQPPIASSSGSGIEAGRRHRDALEAHRTLGMVVDEMNVIDEKRLTEEVVNPALDRLKAEIIPALDAALARNVGALTGSVRSAIDSGLAGLGTLLFQADGDVAKLLAGLDGWTLEVEVPKITIRLTGPKTGGFQVPRSLDSFSRGK